MINLIAYKLFESESHLIPVVRWADRVFTAAELKPQKFGWAGFESVGLCFTPFDGMSDRRIYAWRDILQKHHKKELVPSFYYLDTSKFDIKSEDNLTKFAALTYQSPKAERLMTEKYKIHLTLSNDYEKPLIEIRLLEGCKIKIIDYQIK